MQAKRPRTQLPESLLATATALARSAPVREVTLAGFIIICFLTYANVESLLWSTLATAMTVGVFVAFAHLAGNGADPANPMRAPKQSTLQGAIDRSQAHAVSLFLYAMLGAFVIIGIRRIRGLSVVDPYADWSFTDIPDFWFSPLRAEGIWVYNKAHIRAGFLEFLFFSACLSILLLLYSQHTSVGRRSNLHTATAIFSIVLFFTVARLPPYDIDLIHWKAHIGDAVGVSNGVWPILHSEAHYGFLPAGAYFLVFKLFRLSSLTLVMTVLVATLAAGISAYVLSSKVAQSKWIGLVVATILLLGFHDLQIAWYTPSAGALRWQMMLALGLLLMWTILSDTGLRALLAGTGFGLLSLWDPAVMVFAAVPLTGALLYQEFRLRQRDAITKIVSVLVGGMLPILIILVASSPLPPDGVGGLVRRASATSALFLEGVANLEQSIVWADVLWLGSAFAGVALLSRRIASGEVLRHDGLFFLCALCFAVPPLLYYSGRTFIHASNALAWVMLPASILVARWAGAASSQKNQHTAVVVLGTFFVVTQGIVPAFGMAVSDTLFRYEHDRSHWSLRCAEAVRSGQPCGQEWPTLRRELAAASEPLVDSGDRSNVLLIDACQRDIPIISPIDSLIYLEGGCRPQYGLAFTSSVLTVEQVTRGMDNLLVRNEVVVDRRSFGWEFAELFRKHAEVELQKHGYCVFASPGSEVLTYRRECDDPNDASAVFGGILRLQEWLLKDSVTLKPCQTINVDSIWRADSPLEPDISMTLVLANAEGIGEANSDGSPAGFPTEQWQPGWFYPDDRQVTVPCESTAGEYLLLIGVYKLQHGESRLLSVSLPDGTPLGDYFYLTTLTVED